MVPSLQIFGLPFTCISHPLHAYTCLAHLIHLGFIALIILAEEHKLRLINLPLKQNLGISYLHFEIRNSD